MSSPAQIAQQVTRRKRRALVSAVVVLLVLALGLGWYWGRSIPEQSAADPESTQSAPETPKGDFTPVDTGRFAEGRYHVGFPHTAEGAVSLAIRYTQALSTNEPQSLADAMGVYLNGEVDIERIEQLFLSKRAHQIALSRPTGTEFDIQEFPGAGSYYYIVPQGVWWQEDANGTIEVMILAAEEISDGAGLQYHRAHVYGFHVSWDADLRDHGDWVITRHQDPSSREGYSYKEEEYDLDHPQWARVVLPD